jgi:tRNA threonylcarbamoyladenosine biosynthesis protein TsaB
MKVLGIETTGRFGSVCLCEDGRTLHETVFEKGLAHGRELAPAVAGILERESVDLPSLDLLAACVGPGSYTGIRIGTAFVRVLSRIAGVPTAAVSSLRALAAAEEARGPLLAPVLDARWGMIYAALFRRTDDGLERLHKDALWEPGAFLKEVPEGTFAFGSGVSAHGDLLGTRLVLGPTEPPRRVSAALVARIGLARFQKGGKGEELVPRYLKRWGPPQPP